MSQNQPSPSQKNPRRVAAGKLNRQKRRGLPPAGVERSRQAALERQPWLRSTGPRTAQGKARSAANGRRRQKGELSVRQFRASLIDARSILNDMARCRQLVADLTPNRD